MRDAVRNELAGVPAWERAVSAAVAGALFATALAACSTHSTVTTRTVMPPKTPVSTWTGRSVEEIEKVWGAAPQRESDGEGGTVLVYRKDTAVSVSASAGPDRRSLDPPSPADRSDSQRTESERITKELARFWVNANGKVYRYWFAQEIYDAGKNEPPSSDADE